MAPKRLWLALDNRDSLIDRCIGILFFPKKSLPAIVTRPNERHIIILSLVFGALFAWRSISPQGRDPVFFLTLALSAGVGFVYSSSYFLSWLIRVSGKVIAPQPLRMVLGYSLTPFILALILMLLAQYRYLTGTTAISFLLIVLTWGLNIYGIRVASGIPVIQSLFVTVIPVLALMLIIALLFKLAWMVYGY